MKATWRYISFLTEIVVPTKSLATFFSKGLPLTNKQAGTIVEYRLRTNFGPDHGMDPASLNHFRGRGHHWRCKVTTFLRDRSLSFVLSTSFEMPDYRLRAIFSRDRRTWHLPNHVGGRNHHWRHLFAIPVSLATPLMMTSYFLIPNEE
jgi:hypothetical protein